MTIVSRSTMTLLSSNTPVSWARVKTPKHRICALSPYPLSPAQKFPSASYWNLNAVPAFKFHHILALFSSSCPMVYASAHMGTTSAKARAYCFRTAWPDYCFWFLPMFNSSQGRAFPQTRQSTPSLWAVMTICFQASCSTNHVLQNHSDFCTSLFYSRAVPFFFASFTPSKTSQYIGNSPFLEIYWILRPLAEEIKLRF